jgi:hypothetical protein
VARHLGAYEVAVRIQQVRGRGVATALDERRVAAQVGEQKAAIGGLPLINLRRIVALVGASVVLHARIVSGEGNGPR